MKVKRRPLVFDAVQIREDNLSELVSFLDVIKKNKSPFGPVEFLRVERDFVGCKTTLRYFDANKTVDLYRGDWLVLGSGGELYRVEEKIFETNYSTEV